MKIAVWAPDRLTPAHFAAWARWQRADPTLDGPFFRPELTFAASTSARLAGRWTRSLRGWLTFR